MQTRTTSKWIGAIAAALTLALATPAPHADASVKKSSVTTVVISAKKDSGWDIP